MIDNDVPFADELATDAPKIVKIIPNLNSIGLASDKIRKKYQKRQKGSPKNKIKSHQMAKKDWFPWN